MPNIPFKTRLSTNIQRPQTEDKEAHLHTLWSTGKMAKKRFRETATQFQLFRHKMPINKRIFWQGKKKKLHTYTESFDN